MIRRLSAALLCASLAFAPAAPAAEEVPFLVSPENVTLAMLQIARVGPEDYVIDLGSGDGRIVITAAKRFGARGMGVEIVGELVERSRRNARAAGVAERAHFRELDLFKADLTPASVVTMYLLPDVNLQLRPRLLALRPGTRIVSHDWDMAEWKPDKTLVLDVPDKEVGLEKKSRVHLWVVPARVDGLWCGLGKARGTHLKIAQSFQAFHAVLTQGGESRELEGRIDGWILRYPAGFTLTADGTGLKVTYAGGKFAALKNVHFARPRGAACR